MNAADAGHIKVVWTSIFKRKGGEGPRTRLFDSLDGGAKDGLLQLVPLQVDELAVVGSFESADDWLLLTTSRLAWSRRGRRGELAGEAVVAVKPEADKLRGPEAKRSMRSLVVVTTGGDEHVVETDPGPPLFGLWNVLNNLIERSRRARPHPSRLPERR